MKRVADRSVYRTVLWIFVCPKYSWIELVSMSVKPR